MSRGRSARRAMAESLGIARPLGCRGGRKFRLFESVTVATPGFYPAQDAPFFHRGRFVLRGGLGARPRAGRCCFRAAKLNKPTSVSPLRDVSLGAH